MRKRQPGVAVSGLSLLLVGGWLLAIEFGTPLKGFSEMWPVILVLFGFSMLIQYATEGRKQSGLVFVGTIALLTGIFLSFFTLHVGQLSWPDMVNYWPVFPLTIGVAFMVLYLTSGMRQQALLIPAFSVGGLGIFALPFTLGVIRGTVFSQVVQLWPLLLLLIGLALLVRPRSQRT